MGARKNEFEEDSEDSRVADIFQLLEETGALVMTGLNRNGEPVYRFTEKCKEIFPELYEFHKAEINSTANELWQMGVVDVIFKESTFSVGFTNQNYQTYLEVKDQLTEEQKDFLEVVIGFSLQHLADMELKSEKLKD